MYTHVAILTCHYYTFKFLEICRPQTVKSNAR